MSDEELLDIKLGHDLQGIRLITLRLIISTLVPAQGREH